MFRLCKSVASLMALAIISLSFASVAFAGAKPVKVSLIGQTPASVPAIPTADIAREMSKRCPNVSITRKEDASDYSIEAVGGDRTNPHGQRLFKFTVFDHEGNVAFTTETRQLHNAVKDVCAFINK